MLNMLPDARWPMFRVGQPEDPPGFRIANDGSVGTTSGDSGLASFGRYLPDNAAPLVRIGSNGPTYASDGGVYRAADQAYDPVDGNPSWQDPLRELLTPMLVTTGPAFSIVSSHSSRMSRMPHKLLAQEQMRS